MKVAIQLNGEPYSAEEGASVTALLDSLKLRPARVGVEINRAVVPKAEYDRTIVKAGDVIEIINFVGGG